MSDCQHTILMETCSAIIESAWLLDDDGTYRFHEEIDVQPIKSMGWACAECGVEVEVSDDMRLVVHDAA